MKQAAGSCPERLVVLVLAVIFALSPAASPTAMAEEKPVAAEKNPPGDIPDTQVFVHYASPLGFALEVPEGWSRSDRPDGARFFDKYNIIEATVAPADAAPTASSANSREVVDLAKTGHAVKVTAVKEVKLKSGPALRITYTSNSEPNPVTNKQIRLEHERFIYFKDGKTVTLDFAAPLGADNADQWQLMSNSFRWS
jgi:nucleoid DNA-binding protein